MLRHAWRAEWSEQSDHRRDNATDRLRSGFYLPTEETYLSGIVIQHRGSRPLHNKVMFKRLIFE